MSATGIFHFRIDRPTAIKEFLRAQDYSSEQSDFFLYQGCVYTDGRRCREDGPLTPGTILRLHTRPKKYCWAAGPLSNRLVYNGPDFLVLNKPGGLPVHATLDNYVENAKFLLEQELAIPLFSTHRLDIPTSGLLILAKNREAQSRINGLFAKGQVEKIYRAITAVPVATGEHVLYLNPETRVPREHSFEQQPGWWECRLQILSCAASAPGEYEIEIRLLTGKTHQIRAQLSALGAPVKGDGAYGFTPDSGPLALTCHRLAFRWNGAEVRFDSLVHV